MSFVRYRCGDINLVNKKIHDAFDRYFPNNAHKCAITNVCDDFSVFVSKMLRLILNDKPQYSIVFKNPHGYSAEYLGIRNMHIKNQLFVYFPDVILEIISGMISDDISYTKINYAARLISNTSCGALVSINTTNIDQCTHMRFTYNNTNIDAINVSTFIRCVFVNCRIKSINTCVFIRCAFISCTFSCEIKNSTFRRCNVRNCIMKCVEISMCNISASNINNVTLAESDIRESRVFGCNISALKILSTDIELSKIYYCVIKQCFIGRHASINDVEIKRSWVTDMTICSMNIQDCDIHDNDINQIVIIDCAISDSILSVHVANAFINNIKVTNTFVKCHMTDVNTVALSRDNVTGRIINRHYIDTFVRKRVSRCSLK